MFPVFTRIILPLRILITSTKEDMFSSLFACLFVCNLRKDVPTDLHEIFTDGWQWANEQTIKFWWRSGSRIQIRVRLRIATLVRRTLAEVCTVLVLLVMAAVSILFALWFLLLLLLLLLSPSSSSSFSSPNLSGRRLDVYHTSTHGVALVRI